MSTEIDKLRELSEQCLHGQPLDRELSRWLGFALKGFLSRQYQTVEEALGLRFPQGGVPWWREEAMRKRDAALRALSERFFADLPPSGQAQRIWTLSIRYAASAWHFDRDRGEMPGPYKGTVKEWLWLAFVSGAPMPLRERQLRRILAR